MPAAMFDIPAVVVLVLSALVAAPLLIGGGGGAAEAAVTPVKYPKGYLDPASTHYVVLEPNPRTGQQRFFCLARGRCHFKTITCPAQCPVRKPKMAGLVKGCFADCSSTCETTCKWRLPNCEGYGSVCYDPRFVGGDGVMFYFHGVKGSDYALVSDRRLHINAHLIGVRPANRTRDFTWVQALAVLFDAHSLVVAAKRVSVWDYSLDSVSVWFDGRQVSLPAEADAEWRPEDDENDHQAAVVVVERTAAVNSVKVTVRGLLELDAKVVPIGEEENRTHGYQLPAGDAFAHLEMQFKFGRLSPEVEGVLGKTYRPGYISPVKKGVAMPMMGGEETYRTPAFLSASCAACRFRPPTTLFPAINIPGLARY